MSRGRRTRRRSGARSRTTRFAVLALLLVSALAYGVVGTGAYATGALDRDSSVPVAADADALLALAVADSVTANETSRLVTVTNHLEQSVTVTVALHSAAADDADLVVDGATVGDSASVDLAAGANQTIDVAVDDTASDGDTLGFDVDADGTGVTASAPNRSTTVTT